MLRAGIIPGKQHLLPADNINQHKTAVFKGRFNGIGKAAANFGSHNQSVNHNLNIVFFVFFNRYFLGQVIHVSVDPYPHKAALSRAVQLLDMLSLPSSDYGSHYLNSGFFGKGKYLLNHLIHRLLFYLSSANRTMRNTDTGKKQSHIVMYLGDRSNGRAGIFRGGFLIYGDGGRKTVDAVHIRFFHLSQKHSGIGRKRLDISALTLGIEGIEGKGGFSRARNPSENNQLVPGNCHIYIFKIICPCAFYYYAVSRHCPSPLLSPLFCLSKTRRVQTPAFLTLYAFLS